MTESNKCKTLRHFTNTVDIRLSSMQYVDQPLGGVYQNFKMNTTKQICNQNAHVKICLHG